MPQKSPGRWFIVGGVVVLVSLLAAVFIANERERRARGAVRNRSAAIMLELKEDIDVAAGAMHDFNTAGGLDLAGLEEKAALERRIVAATKAQGAVERVLARGDSAPERLGEASRGLPTSRVDEAQRELPQKMNWAEGRQVFETHRRAYAAARAQLEFMHKHHGRWRVDAVGMSVNWSSKELQAQAAKLAQEVDAARAAQEALSRGPSTAAATARAQP